jgi:Luciferase-like monooxygenase
VAGRDGRRCPATEPPVPRRLPEEWQHAVDAGLGNQDLTVVTRTLQPLEEAVKIVRALWDGGSVTYRGKHFDVESAKIWDRPDSPPPIGIGIGPIELPSRGTARRRHDRGRASSRAW